MLHVCSWKSAKALENAYWDLSLRSRFDKVFFSTYIHSAAPICGIDPAQRQRVDSEYQL
jgi:hypothetical protein